VSVGKAFAVDMAKCLEEQSKYLTSFFFTEGTMGENLSEVFLCVFHEHENQIRALKLAAAAR